MAVLSDRRTFIKALATIGPLFTFPAAMSFAGDAPKSEEDVSPAEDLMREHGGLNRILLIYEEAIRRLAAKESFDPGILKSSAEIIKNFIESYHEKLEEEFLFPRFRDAGKMVDLVTTLETQHKAGRKLTAQVIDLSNVKAIANGSDKNKLILAMRSFIRMYRPHEAREDTILFPAFKTLVTPKEYDALGDKFEDREHELFGKEGFEGVVVQIGELEKKIDIYDLSKFTPKTSS